MKEEVREVGTRQFLTGSFKPHGVFLPGEDYAEVLDNIVIACVDCILIHEKGKMFYEKILKMLLGKRTQELWPDWWIIGGRMMPGETFEQAAARNVKRELDLEVEPSRFQYLGTYSLVWIRRSQPPQENGYHTVSITMVLEIDDREAAAIKPNDEFSELEWVRPEMVEIEVGLHPAVIQYAKDLIEFLRKRNE